MQVPAPSHRSHCLGFRMFWNAKVTAWDVVENLGFRLIVKVAGNTSRNKRNDLQNHWLPQVCRPLPLVELEGSLVFSNK